MGVRKACSHMTFCLSEVGSTFAQEFPAATVFNLGENQFTYVSETHIKLISGGEKARFCVAMARLRRIRTSAASQSM